MAEVKVRYNNSDIAAIQKPGGMTLQTAGKYMGDNVEVQYTDPNPNVIQDQDGYIVLSDEAGSGGITVNDIAKRSIGKNIVITETDVAKYAFAGADVETVEFIGTTRSRDYSFSECKSLTSVSFTGVDQLQLNGFSFNECSALETFIHPYRMTVGERNFYNCQKLGPYMVFNPDGIWTSCFQNCKELVRVDIGSSISATRANMFSGCTKLNMVVIRKSTVIALNNTNAFSSSPFASDGTGGTLYVPSSLVDSYQSASNWSTIIGYANNQIKSIESTHTDPNAPIDLTLYYADGTLIPTT